MAGRTPLVVAAALAVAGAALLALSMSAPNGDADRSASRREIEVDVAGAELVDETWQDEEHVRYIDTGGYDERAGWTLSYSLDEPMLVPDLLDRYEDTLVERGWSVLDRDDRSCTLRLTDSSPPEARTETQPEARTVEVGCRIAGERESSVGPDDSPLSTTIDVVTNEFEVSISLPFTEEPRYPG